MPLIAQIILERGPRMVSATIAADAARTETSEIRRRPLAAIGSSSWIPAGVVAVATVAALLFYGVSIHDIATFSAYSIGCVTLPGILIWRALRGRSDVFALDVAGGTALGSAIEIPVYVLMRYLDIPVAVIVWPVATIVTFLAIPGLRRHWRAGAERMPAGVAWTIAGFGLLMLVQACAFFRTEGLTGAAANAPEVDLPFEMSLVSEFKHHFPPTTPFVTGAPLQYHWYVHAHGAAASWLSGVDTQVLILRLLPLPLLAAFPILLVSIAKTVTRRWWPGLVALALLFFGVAAVPYMWRGASTFSGTIFDDIWVSPTQTFAATLFAAAMFVLVELLRRPAEGRRSWILFAVLAGGVAGAKATFLPMLLCGLVAGVVVEWIVSRRPGRALPALAIVVGWLAFAQFVVFGGGNQALVFAPLATAKWTGVGQVVLGQPRPANPWVTLLTIVLISLLACAFAWVGAVGLLRAEWRRDQSIVVMAGYAAAGIGATYVFAHPGLSQIYFARSAGPYLAILAALGIAALVSGESMTNARERTIRLTTFAVAAAVGCLATVAIRHTIGSHKPPRGPHMTERIALPYVVLIVVLVLFALVVWFGRRTLRIGTGVVVALIAVACIGSTLPTGVQPTQSLLKLATSGAPLRNVVGNDVTIPAGGIAAATWLRDHSQPGDLVATNQHCRTISRGQCDSRDFWLAAYAERRVLVEGWSYTEKELEATTLWTGGQLATSTFWDLPLLAQNDAVFSQPTAADVTGLAHQYGVRWLFAVGPTASPQLSDFATLRFHSGDVSIYEVSG